MEKEKARQLLVDLERRHKKSIEILEVENTQPDGSSSQAELSLYDNHPADIATEVFKREHDMALQQRDLNEISAIEMALDKLEKDEYGVCERCKKEIGDERLELVPYTRFCIECENKVSEYRLDSKPYEVNALKHREKVFREHDNDEILEQVFSSGSSSTPSEIGRNRDFKDKGFVKEFEEINKSQGEIE